MDFGVIYQLKVRNYWWLNTIMYFSFALLLATVICFFIFNAKISSLQMKLQEAQNQTATMGTPDQKATEAKVFNYQKKIDDFAIIFGDHKAVSNIFALLENLTLPDVWYYNFSAASETGSIQLSGEAENEDALTWQVSILSSSEFIKDVSNLSSGIISTGRVRFSLTLTLDPSLFTTHVFDSVQNTGQ